MHTLPITRLWPRAVLAACLGAVQLLAPWPAQAQATFVQTPYKNPKVLFDFYLDNHNQYVYINNDNQHIYYHVHNDQYVYVYIDIDDCIINYGNRNRGIIVTD